MNSVNIQIGQIWKDNDNRNNYPGKLRTIRITDVGDKHIDAVCIQSGRKTRIMRSKFGIKHRSGFSLYIPPGSEMQATISVPIEFYKRLCSEVNMHIAMQEAKIEPVDRQTVLCAVFIRDAMLVLPDSEEPEK